LERPPVAGEGSDQKNKSCDVQGGLGSRRGLGRSARPWPVAGFLQVQSRGRQASYQPNAWVKTRVGSRAGVRGGPQTGDDRAEHRVRGWPGRVQRVHHIQRLWRRGRYRKSVEWSWWPWRQGAGRKAWSVRVLTAWWTQKARAAGGGLFPGVVDLRARPFLLARQGWRARRA